MTAGTHNLVIEKGATFSRTFTYKDANGALINLTGYTARMHIRKQKGSVDMLVSLTSSSGITLGGALGTVAIVISATATAAIAVDSGVYDIELVTGDTVLRFLEGTVTFSPEVTR